MARGMIQDVQRLLHHHTCSTSYAPSADVMLSSNPRRRHRLHSQGHRGSSLLHTTSLCQQGCRSHCRVQVSQQGTTCRQRPAQLQDSAQQHSQLGEHAVGCGLAALGSLLLAAAPALAEEGAKYDPAAGGDLVKNVAGVAYLGLVLFFILRLLNKRARTATGERLAPKAYDEPEALLLGGDKPAPSNATPWKALLAALQAGGCAYALFLLSQGVDGFFEGQALPEQYTARNITVSIRTIVRGLSYLCTFIFAANALGLSALTVQMLFFPEADTVGAAVKDTAGAAVKASEDAPSDKLDL